MYREMFPKPYRLSHYERSQLPRKKVFLRLKSLFDLGMSSYSIQGSSRYIRDRFWGRYTDDPNLDYPGGGLKWLHSGFS